MWGEEKISGIFWLKLFSYSRVRSWTARHRIAVFLRSKFRSKTFRFSSFTNLSRCLSERYVVHVSVHWQARSKSPNRVSWLWSLLRRTTVSLIESVIKALSWGKKLLMPTVSIHSLHFCLCWPSKNTFDLKSSNYKSSKVEP